MFINHLPNGKDTKQFSTEDASGSTSQAANVIEAMEAGAHTLPIDEDTSATNFMVRDELMPVSYTHLDVYKRQVLGLCYMGAAYMSQHYERTVETAVLGATYVGNSYLANTF